MRLRSAFVAVLMLALLTAVGCAASAPATVQPALGLHSMGDSAGVADTTYTVTADFSPMPDRPEIELMTVRVTWTSTIPHKWDDLNIQAFAADGSPRVEPADAESLGGTTDEMHGSDSGSNGEATALFSVRKGETGLVVTVDNGKSPDLRWQAR